MDAGPDRVLNLRATVRAEDSGEHEGVEGGMEMVQRCRLDDSLGARMVGGRERGVEEARLGSRKLQSGLADRAKPESGARRRVWPRAHPAHASGHAPRELFDRLVAHGCEERIAV